MISFRPHHFLCTLGFEGKGYSEEFVRGFQEIVDFIRAPGNPGDTTSIQVTIHADSICQPCPNKVGESCTSAQKIKQLDDAHSEILNLKHGDLITWGEAKKRIAQQMTLEKFEKACEPCAWKTLGVCKAALIRLKEGQNG